MAAPVWESIGTVVNNAGGTYSDITISRPTVNAGDLMIAQVRVVTGRTITAPAGWTEIWQANDSSVFTFAVFWKIATGSEPASYTFTISGGTSSQRGGVIHRVSGTHQTAPIHVFAGTTGSSSTTATLTGVTTTVNDTLLMTALTPGNAFITCTPTTDWTERVDTANFAQTRDWLTAGATGSVQVTLSSTVTYRGVVFAIAPVPPNRPAIAHHYRQMRG